MSMVHWHGIVVVSTLQLLCMQAWRCVESQHIASSMKLVDSADEQRVLENLLEASKPRHCRKKLRTNTFCSLPPSGTRPRKTHAFAVQVKRASGTALLTYTPHCVRLPTGGVCLSRTMQPTARQWRRATSSQQTILFLMHRCAAVLMLDALSEITNKPIQSTTENWRCMVKHGSVVFVRDVLGERQTHVFSE
jgi:hypothetical protein